MEGDFLIAASPPLNNMGCALVHILARASPRNFARYVTDRHFYTRDTEQECHLRRLFNPRGAKAQRAPLHDDRGKLPRVAHIARGRAHRAHSGKRQPRVSLLPMGIGAENATSGLRCNPSFRPISCTLQASFSLSFFTPLHRRSVFSSPYVRRLLGWPSRRTFINKRANKSGRGHFFRSRGSEMNIPQDTECAYKISLSHKR